MSGNAKKNICWIAQFFGGGSAYGLLEIFWRGYTHISMLILGGICFWVLIRLANTRVRLPVITLTGGVCITFLEFVAGCVVNLWLGLNVWDYSFEPCQLLGQICIRFFLLWCVICAAIIPICRRVSKYGGFPAIWNSYIRGISRVWGKRPDETAEIQAFAKIRGKS